MPRPHKTSHSAGMRIVLNDTLCRVTEVTTVRQGKHGQAKCNVAGKSVRTGTDVGPDLAAGTKEYAPGSADSARMGIMIHFFYGWGPSVRVWVY